MNSIGDLLKNYNFLKSKEVLKILKKLEIVKKNLDSKPNSDWGSELFSLNSEDLLNELFLDLEKNYNIKIEKTSIEYKIIYTEVYKLLHKKWFGKIKKSNCY